MKKPTTKRAPKQATIDMGGDKLSTLQNATLAKIVGKATAPKEMTRCESKLLTTRSGICKSLRTLVHVVIADGLTLQDWSDIRAELERLAREAAAAEAWADAARFEGKGDR